MSYLQKSYNLFGGQTISVEINLQTNVMLMDPLKYSSYKKRSFEHYGGNFKTSPANIKVTHTGLWYLVVDLGGRAGRINTLVRIYD